MGKLAEAHKKRMEDPERQEKLRKLIEQRDRFSPIELTGDNVNTIYRRCLPSEETDRSDIVGFWLFSKKRGFERDEGVAYFSKSALQRNRSNIYYLLGQLYDVNHPEADGFDGFVHVKNISLNYKGEPWIEASDNKEAWEIVFRLMMLGLGTRNGPGDGIPFLCPPKRVADGGENIDICENFFVRPTMSPKDPDFEKWSQSEEGALLLSMLKNGEEIPTIGFPLRLA